jgi:benzaldehyde dehydrogenase (NAD)
MTLLDPALWSDKIFINGWVAGNGGTRDVVAPATGEKLGSIGLASVEDVLAAAKVAKAAQVGWAAKKPEERAAVLRKAGELIEHYAEEIHAFNQRECGSIPAKAALETHVGAAECFEASALPTHPMGQVLPSNDARWSFSRRRPAGVVSVIAPFNVPLILSIRSVAPALALGNAVLLKPDPRTAVSGGVLLVRIFQEAGLPDGLLSLLPGGVEVGEAVVSAPEVRVISFTGSTAAGRKVGELGARHLKRVHLELGGNNAMIVLPGADLALAASAGAFGSFLHQGQICMTTGRHIVHESLHDDYVKLLSEKASHLPVGDTAGGQVALGPVIDVNSAERIQAIVDATVAQGATLSAGGTHEGALYKPTVLSNMKTSMTAWTDEIFGPVAPVFTFKTVEEAIALAADSDYGLALAILGDVGEAMKIADVINCGIIHINEQTVSDEAQIPFGGMGNSGTGSRFGGAEANIEAFTEGQWLTVRSDIAPYPF